ncbi:MAG: FliM/FliN family flagellar motor switch protein [Erythrobacter sp.]
MNEPISSIQRFGDVKVRLSVELGRTDLPLKEVLALGEGSVVPLNRLTDELLDVTANGRQIAKAEVIAQEGRFALRIVSLAGEELGTPEGGAPAKSQAKSPGPDMSSEPADAGPPS